MTQTELGQRPERKASYIPAFDVLSYPRNIASDGFLIHLDTVLGAADRNGFTQPRSGSVSPLQRLIDTALPVGILVTGTSTHETLDRLALSEAQRAKVHVFQTSESNQINTNNFSTITGTMGINLESTTILSDDEAVLNTANTLGMGAVHVEKPEGIEQAINLFVDPAEADAPFYNNHVLYSAIQDEIVASELYRPDAIHVVGVVGRTGAGKSTTIRRIRNSVPGIAQASSMVEIDSFFRRSRRDRRAWLNEPGITEEERAERQRVVNWWDLDRAAETLHQIRSGERVNLTGMYDMQQGGEMVGVVNFEPNPSGSVVFVEGTPLLLPQLEPEIDTFVYLNVHDQVRTRSLRERNLRDGYTPEESTERKRLTDAAETGEHIAHGLRVARFQGGRLVVLDNSKRGNDYVKLAPPYIPKH